MDSSTQPVNVPVPPVQTVPVKKRRGAIIGTIVVIILVLIAAWAWWKYHARPQPAASQPDLAAIRAQMNAISPPIPPLTDTQMAAIRTKMNDAAPAASATSTPSETQLEAIRAQMNAAAQ